MVMNSYYDQNLRNLSVEEKTEVAIKRGQELKNTIQDYLDIKNNIPTGFNQKDKNLERKNRIMQMLNATEENWNDWKWQLRNRVTKVDQLTKYLNLSENEKSEIKKVGERYRWAVSPYYLSLMDQDDPEDPIRKQGIPAIAELEDGFGEADPMGEEFTSPAHILQGVIQTD